jgi:excisionase family DNA binding protein
MSTVDTAPLRSVAEVAHDLHVSKVTVYRAIERGELAAVRLGVSGPLRIPESAVERFLRPTVEEASR